MDEIGGPYAKWNKLEKDRYCIISIVRNLKKKIKQQQQQQIWNSEMAKKSVYQGFRVEEIGMGL